MALLNQNREIGMALAMLMEAFRVDEQALTDVQIRLLQQCLGKIPPALIEPAVMHTINTRTSKCKDWLPSNAELLSDAETVRKQLFAAHEWTPCAECESTPRFRPHLGTDGISRMERCPCVVRHQQMLTDMGVTSQPIAVPERRQLSEVNE
jgi:hypothetical protein